MSLHLKLVSKGMRREQCDARCQQIHETTVRRVRDLSLFEYRVVPHALRRTVLVRTSRRATAAGIGMAGPLPANDGTIRQGWRETAASRQRTSGDGLLRVGLAHSQIDRQDALARTRGRAGPVDDPPWTSLRCIRAIATRRWWSIPSAVRCHGSDRDALARQPSLGSGQPVAP